MTEKRNYYAESGFKASDPCHPLSDQSCRKCTRNVLDVEYPSQVYPRKQCMAMCTKGTVCKRGVVQIKHGKAQDYCWQHLQMQTRIVRVLYRNKMQTIRESTLQQWKSTRLVEAARTQQNTYIAEEKPRVTSAFVLRMLQNKTDIDTVSEVKPVATAKSSQRSLQFEYVLSKHLDKVRKIVRKHYPDVAVSYVPSAKRNPLVLYNKHALGVLSILLEMDERELLAEVRKRNPNMTVIHMLFADWTTDPDVKVDRQLIREYLEAMAEE